MLVVGTVGLPEGKLKELCKEVGFSSVRRVPLENPFNNLYEVTPQQFHSPHSQVNQQYRSGSMK
jgi:hypothetical protein